MPYTETGSTKLFYEVLGDDAAPAVLLIEGFSAQLVGWRDGFCQTLIDRGFKVIRFDNRDVGLSQRFGGPEDLGPTYTLSTMADDACQLLDALGVESAHVVGQSMGGMIAQVMASERPERVASVTFIYTAPAVEERYFLTLQDHSTMAFEPMDRETFVETFLAQETFNCGPDYPVDEPWIREYGGRYHDRGLSPDGMMRQRWAILAGGLGTPFTNLRAVTMPSAVIHGRNDPLIHESAGIDLATALPRAELHLFPGMGHVIAQPLWGAFADIIARTAARA